MGASALLRGGIYVQVREGGEAQGVIKKEGEVSYGHGCGWHSSTLIASSGQRAWPER
jgi:hypothetical protein